MAHTQGYEVMSSPRVKPTPQPKPITLWHIGKHKGTKITELPWHYLCWVIENLPEHKAIAQREQTRRRRAVNKSNART